MRRYLYSLLFDDGSVNPARSRFESAILALILLNVAAVMLETVAAFNAVHSAGLRYFEVFSVAVFTVEYLARLWVCTLDPRYAGAVRGRLRYARTPLAVIDLLAILPFYLPFFVAMDLRYLRALRLFRLFRILKMARYSVSLAIMARAWSVPAKNS